MALHLKNVRKIGFMATQKKAMMNAFHLGAVLQTKQKPILLDPTRCTLIPGDGVGPELINSVMEVFAAVSVPIEFETYVFSELDGARHTYAEAVGKNVANPTAMLLCAVKLLNHVNLSSYARKIKEATRRVLLDGQVRTKDLGGNSSTTEFTKAVIYNLR